MRNDSGQDAEPAQILIVDDTAFNLKVLQDILSSHGYRVRPASSGKLALLSIEIEIPDLILLDVAMPRMDGYEVCQRLKADDISRQIPVIFISAMNDVADKIRGFEAGGVDYITKPFNIEEVLARVGAHIRLRSLQKQLEVQNDRLQKEIGDHARSQMELRAAHTKIERLFDAIPFLLVSLTPEGMVTRWNPVAEELFRVKKNEAEGRSLKSCPIPWEWDKISAGMADCMDNNRTIPLEDLKLKYPDEEERILGLTVVPIQRDVDAQAGLILLGADITGKRLAESLSVQAQKLESIGQLAAGIAHEINTPLQYISDNVHFLQKAFATIQPLLQESGAATAQAEIDYLMQETPLAIQESLEGLGRVAHIVMALKEFSGPSSGEKTYININQALQTALTVSRNEWKDVAEIETELDQSLPPVMCSPGEINQALLNIIVNAAQAIAVKIKQEGFHKGIIAIKTSLDRGEVVISISDTGIGIPDGIQSRIFDPFFTTRDVGEGMGQGLTIARAIVTHRHQGSLTFESECGKGSTFQIRLQV